MSFLSMIPWKLVGIGLAVLALTGLVHSCQHYQKRTAQLEVQLDSAIEVSNANAEGTKDYVAKVERSNEIAGNAAQVKNVIRNSADRRRNEISQTLPENDGPLAPVLRDQLNRLPVAAGPDAAGSATTASDTGGTAFADAGSVSAEPPRDAERRGGRH